MGQKWVSTAKALFLTPFLTKRRINYAYMKLQYMSTYNRWQAGNRSLKQKKKFKFQPNFTEPALINTDHSEHNTNLGDIKRLMLLSIDLFWLSD